ncbi:UreF-domain-containing protein [Nemania sp. NC0429]|nr:UreF-domain-containing protein [Nemania sp. NC0429]
MSEVPSEHDDESMLENEIAELESQLAATRERLIAKRRAASTSSTNIQRQQQQQQKSSPARAPLDSSHHYLLLLADSALPLGSFAFSSGLESYLAHVRSQSQPHRPSFASFLPLSLSSYASTTLPFVLAAHRDPSALADLDDVLDASIICAVGRRASIAQGRALLSVWEKSLAPSSSTITTTTTTSSSSSVPAGPREVLDAFSAALRRSSASARKADSGEADSEEEHSLLPPPVSAHLGPLFGALARLLGLTLRQAAYVFLLGHAKALVSAAVRASMFGPYQAQKVLAGEALQVLIADMVEREWGVRVEDAGQSVPVMDLWIGRHEMLYSRIFNS